MTSECLAREIISRRTLPETASARLIDWAGKRNALDPIAIIASESRQLGLAIKSMWFARWREPSSRRFTHLTKGPNA